MRRRLWVSVALTVVLVMSALLLAACDPQVTLGDIFVSYTSEGEITRAELQFTLPVGWTVLTDSAANYSSLHADSDIGYVKSLGAYIVTDGDGNLNLVRPDGEGGAVFMLHGSDGGTAFGAEAIVVKGDLVLMRINNGSASVVDLSTGREVLTQSETTGISVSKETGIEDAVRILDDELIAVAPAYSSAVSKGQTAYTPVYRASTGGLAAMVYNPGGSLDGVYGFDGEYVTVDADTPLPLRSPNAPPSSTAYPPQAARASKRKATWRTISATPATTTSPRAFISGMAGYMSTRSGRCPLRANTATATTANIIRCSVLS